MDLTAWQRICNRILGPVVKKRARSDKKLSDDLVKGSMGMMVAYNTRSSFNSLS